MVSCAEFLAALVLAHAVQAAAFLDYGTAVDSYHDSVGESLLEELLRDSIVLALVFRVN